MKVKKKKDIKKKERPNLKLCNYLCLPKDFFKFSHDAQIKILNDQSNYKCQLDIDEKDKKII